MSNQYIKSATLKLLNKTKEVILKKERIYICNALETAAEYFCTDNQYDYEIISQSIKKYITNTLKNDTYSVWLNLNHPEFYASKFNHYDDYCFIQGRVQWLDYMIKQVKNNEFIFFNNSNKNLPKS